MKLTPRHKIIGSLGLTALALGILASLVVWPSIQEIHSLNSQIDQQRLQLEELYQKGRNIKKTLEEYRAIKPTLTSLDRVFVKRGQELAFITTLESVAHETGVTQELKQNTAPSPEGNSTLSLQLQLSGTLEHILAYLSRLEALDYYVNIDLVRLSRSGNQDGNPTLSAIFLATTYLTP